jgi:hypothetical protein
MHPSWKQLPEWVIFVENGLLIERIVIARKENNRAAPAVPDRERRGETLPPVLRGFRCIEDVSSPQHCIDRVLLGERQDLLDDCEPRARELTAIVSIELAELTAQVQIGGVEQLQHLPSPAAISN